MEIRIIGLRAKIPTWLLSSKKVSRNFCAVFCSYLLQVGLVEQEWLDTLANINPEEVTFIDFIEAGRKLGAQLKQEVGCKI